MNHCGHACDRDHFPATHRRYENGSVHVRVYVRVDTEDGHGSARLRAGEIVPGKDERRKPRTIRSALLSKATFKIFSLAANC